MNRIFILSAFSILLLLFFAACDDDNDIVGPGEEVPEFPTIELEPPDTETRDQGYQLISGLTNSINTQSQLAFGLFSAAGAEQTQDGWRWTRTINGVTVNLTSELRGDGNYEWQLVLDGQEEDGTTYDNWVALEGISSPDGNFGSITYFFENTTVPNAIFEWETEADGTKEADIAIYNEDDNMIDWQSTIINSPDGSGSAVVYESSNGDLYLYFDAEWNPEGSGSWNHYNVDGDVINSGEWE